MRRNLSSRTLVPKFNRSHVNIGRATTSQSLLLLLARLTYIKVLFFAHIPFVVNHTINATPPERLQQYNPHGFNDKVTVLFELHQDRWMNSHFLLNSF